MTLQPAEIASMRATVNRTIRDMVCTIQRRSSVITDPDGAPVYTWADHLVDIPCHYWEEQDKEDQGVPNATITRLRMVLAEGTSVTDKDRVSQVKDVDGDVIAGNLNITEVLLRINDVVLQLEAVK